MTRFLIGLCLLALNTVMADTLRVFTWEEYVDPDIIAEFEQQTGHSVEFIYYENDELRDQILAETDGFGYDLILVDDVKLPAYIRQGWLSKIDDKLVPNLKFHGERWRTLVPDAAGYAVPYGWGNYGIVYRNDLVDTPPTRWSDLFSLDSEYNGRMQLPPQASELLVLSMLALGIDPNNDNAADLKRAEELIRNQKPNVYSYSYPDFNAKPFLLGEGSVTVAVTYNSDAQLLLENDERLSFVSPVDGNIFWVDLLTISARSKKQELAHQLLNYLLDPAIVARNVEYHYTATFSNAAIEMLPDDITQDPTVFPNISGNITTIKPPKRNAIRSMMRIINALGID